MIHLAKNKHLFIAAVTSTKYLKTMCKAKVSKNNGLSSNRLNCDERQYYIVGVRNNINKSKYMYI